MNEVNNVSPASAPESYGMVFGNYRVVRCVGAGGMAVVYEAVHAGLNKRVAIKALHPCLASSEHLRQRFMREGEATSRIRHPHIVDVTDIGEQQQTPYLVMEYLEGEDLGAVLEREGRLPVQHTADLMIPVLAAIAAAHRGGVIHRDLKPANIFVARTPQGVRAVVLDFGISKFIDAGDRLPRISGETVLGTPEYMSPEQTRGGAGVDVRTDQYALGVILYECLTGRPPFSAHSIAALLENIEAGSHLRASDIRASLPDGIDELITRAMNRDPVARFPSVADMASALLPFASVKTRMIWSEALGANPDDIECQPVRAGPSGAETAAFPLSRLRTTEKAHYAAEAAHADSPMEKPRAALRPAWLRAFGSRNAMGTLAMGMILIAMAGVLVVASARGAARVAPAAEAPWARQTSPRITMESVVGSALAAPGASRREASANKSSRNEPPRPGLNGRSLRRASAMRRSGGRVTGRSRSGASAEAVPARKRAPVRH